jgi:hypothetical protein
VADTQLPTRQVLRRDPCGVHDQLGRVARCAARRSAVAFARMALEYECDFRERIGQLHRGEDHWWNVRPPQPTRGIVTDVLVALETALPWLDAYSDLRFLLTEALPKPSTVNGFGLAALVALAKKTGAEAEVEAAQAELRRLQRGDRLSW